MPKRTPKSEQVDEATATTPPATEGATVTELKPKKGRKQAELPGMESPKHPEMDALVEMYMEQASTLSTARFNVGETKAKIIELAEKLGLSVYRDDTASPPLVLTLTEAGVKVKVTPVGTALDDEPEAEE